MQRAPHTNGAKWGQWYEPLSVRIARGPDYVDKGESLTFDSSVHNADGPVSYQWYHQTHPGGPWYEKSGEKAPTYTHLFDFPEGTSIDYEHQAVKVVVTSAGETAFNVFEIHVIDCSKEHHLVGIQPMAPCR